MKGLDNKYHLVSCNVFKNYYNTLEKFLPADSLSRETFLEMKTSNITDKRRPPEERFNIMCCCSGDIPHNEELKFIIDGEEDGELSDASLIEQDLNWKQFKSEHPFENPDEFKASKIYDNYDEDQKLLIEALITEQLY